MNQRGGRRGFGFNLNTALLRVSSSRLDRSGSRDTLDDQPPTEVLGKLALGAVLDPVVFAPAVALSAALVSGLAARVVELCEESAEAPVFASRRSTKKAEVCFQG